MSKFKKNSIFSFFMSFHIICLFFNFVIKTLTMTLCLKTLIKKYLHLKIIFIFIFLILKKNIFSYFIKYFIQKKFF